jgi:hypothetical protein
MAIWQFDLHYIPRAALQARYAMQPAVISDEEFDSVDWWSHAAISLSTVERLLETVPPAPSWREGLLVCGSDDGNRIDVSFAGAMVQSVFARIDTRTISYAFLETLVKLADENEWVLRLQDRRILPPSTIGLMSAIQRSDSFRFVVDPATFLNELSKRRAAEKISDAPSRVVGLPKAE